MVCLFLPNIIPLSVIAEYFRQLYDPSFGVLFKFFNLLFGFTTETAPSYLSNPQYANGMLYFYTVWFGFGYNSILLWGAFSGIPQEVIESAELDGVTLAISLVTAVLMLQNYAELWVFNLLSTVIYIAMWLVGFFVNGTGLAFAVMQTIVAIINVRGMVLWLKKEEK